jgi:hypothetical protein
MDGIDYTKPGSLTALDTIAPQMLAGMGSDPVAICAPVHLLVLQPSDAEMLELSTERFATNQLRPAAHLVEALLDLQRRPLREPRSAEMRVVGTCRHFAVLSCALLRYHGVASRVRCGFATYFQPGQSLDHWITEYWNIREQRWVRVDSEVLGAEIIDHAHDLRPGDFLSGGEAWAAYRSGDVDASTFGVYGTDNFGPAKIRGNLVKDLAALNKVEMLPWDEWGRMTAAYAGETGADYDELLDTVTAVCATDDDRTVADTYGHDDLRVPGNLVC